jgi:hypothetical protein
MGAFRHPAWILALFVSALSACKSGEKKRPAPDQAPDPSAELAKRRLSLGASDFRRICEGASQSVPDAQPNNGNGPRVIAFVEDTTRDGGTGFVHHATVAGALSDLRAVDSRDASVVACVQVLAKKNGRKCVLSGEASAGELTLYDADFRIRVIEAQTGKVLANEVKPLKNSNRECPKLAIVEQADEWLPAWENWVYTLVTNAK